MGAPLSGEKIYFAAEQLQGQVLDILSRRVERLGGQVTRSRDSATIIILNPSHDTYPAELERLTYVASNYPNIPQPTVMPYHWISACHLTATKVPLSALPTEKPYFTHPDRSASYQPLKAWVSVNIAKLPEEKPEDAKAAVVRDLELGGALVVEKRAQADVLLVDTSTNFYKTIQAEREKNGRMWQKLAERDWVDDCVRFGRMNWRTVQMEIEEDEADSMAEDTEMRNGKGPGRPTGKPRVEYTPQDDDFLCRWLAAYYSEGAWQSRKTYQFLASPSTIAMFPLADRHSDQSWHERFKKNAAIFSKRVHRFCEGGIDHKLRTKKEREKDIAEHASRNEAGESATMPQEQGSTAQREGARLTEIALRALERSTEPEAGPSHNRPEGLAPVVVDQVQIVTVSNNDAAPGPKKRKLVESDDGQSPPETAPVTISNHMAEPPAEALSKPVMPNPPITVNDESQETHTSNGHVPRLATGVETQAVLADFALAREEAARHAIARATASPSKRNHHVRIEAPGLESQRYSPPRRAHASEPPFAHSPPRRHRASEPPHPHRGSPRQNPINPRPEVRPATELIRQRATLPINHYPSPAQSDRRSAIHPATDLIRSRASLPAVGHSSLDLGSTRLSIPFRMTLDVRGIEADGSGVRVESVDGERYETPSPGRQRTLLRDEIQSSSVKRRRAEERAVYGGSAARRRSSPDKVYASTAIAPLRHTERDPSSPRPRERTMSPELSPAQRSEKIVRGASIVQTMREEYKRRIVGWATKYDISFAEVNRIMGELPKKKGGVYWEDAEEGMRNKFGF